MTSRTSEAPRDKTEPAGDRKPRGAEPAPGLAELLARSKEKLLALAAELKLKGVSKLAKSDLARRILAAHEERRGAEAPAQAAAAPQASSGSGQKAAAEQRSAASPPSGREKPAVSAAKAAVSAAKATVSAAKAVVAAEAKAAVSVAKVAVSAAKAAKAAIDAKVEETAEEAKTVVTAARAAVSAAKAAIERKVEAPAAEARKGATEGAGAVPAEPPSPAAAAKLDLGPGAARTPSEEHIPWGYAQDRVTAMAVDPDSLYVYWEVTDPAMERARAALGEEGAGAWLSLRVYDITGLIFDGTNAHSSFDHGVGRFDRQWFFTIGKPSSSAIVEIGMRGQSGAFARLARSSRVDFPRSSPAPWTEPEWMTVLASGDVLPAGRGAPARPGGGAPPPGPGPGGGGGQERFEHVPMWVLLEPGEGERRFRELFGEAFERIEWQEAHGEGWYELQGRMEWQVGPMVTSWEAGPFTYPVQVEPPTRATWEGGAIAYTANGVTRVVYGPWQVVIKNLSGRTERAVLGRWQIYRSWTTKGGLEQVQWMATRSAGAPGGASERLAASAWLWSAGSETRLGGASELWRLGASEVRLAGASEVMYAGASERRLAGASERRLAGASEWRMGGASEQRLAGASERRLAGASERRLAGASERRLGGASEGRLSGASERRLGASEHRLGAGDETTGGDPARRG